MKSLKRKKRNNMQSITVDNSFNINTLVGSTSYTTKLWNDPILKETREVGESIEMIYFQTSMYSRTGGIPPYHDERIFKIVYSCVDGKWNKSEPIYGKIIKSYEYYEF